MRVCSWSTALGSVLLCLAFPALAGSGPGTGPLRRLPPAVGAPGTAPAGPAAAHLPDAVVPDAGSFDGRIEVYREPRDEGYEGPALTERVEALAAARRLILLRSAQFDPLRQGMPDFGEFVPTALEYGVPPAGANTHWLVQFERALGPAELAGLRALGGEPLYYVPNDAVLVRIDHDHVSQLWTVDGVRFVGRFLPGFKVENSLAREARTIRRDGEAAGLVELQVLLTPGADAELVAAAVRAGLPRAEALAAGDPVAPVVRVRGAAVELPQLVVFLANLEDALFVQRFEAPRLLNDDAVWIAQTFDTANKRNYALTLKVHNKGIQGHGQIVGVIDSGVDPDVCWVIDRSLGNIPAQSVAPPGAITVNTSRQKIIAYNVLRDFEGPAVAYEVGSSHGTEVVSCLTGDRGGSAGVYSDPSIVNGSHHNTADGMAPGAKVIFLDAGDATGIAGLRTPDVADTMFVQQYNAGARISTNSWGTQVNGYDLLAYYADRMIFNYPDFAIFVPAGNTGPGLGSVDSWGNAKNVVVVGGTRQDPQSVSMWVGAGRGPAADGRLKPDVTLTASGVVSGRSDLTTGTETCATSVNDGTSFSTPLAAGAGVLVRQYFTEGWYPSGAKTAADAFTPSAALIKAVLLNGARNMTGDGGGNVGPCFPAIGGCLGAPSVPCTTNAQCDFTRMDDDAPSNYQGFGRVHLDDTLFFAGDTRDLRVFDVARQEGLATGEEWRSQVYVPGTAGGDLELVLTWTDPPSLAPALSFLVNDLDVVLVAPNGNQYWGNSLATRDANNATVEYTVANQRRSSRIDNVEYVRIPAAQAVAGIWTLRVIGSSVPGSLWGGDASLRQGFAIALAGDFADTGGTAEFDQETYSCADTIRVRVRDANAGATVNVTVATASGDVELRTLASIGGGRYEGTLPSAFNAPLDDQDGVLQLVQGERISVTYTDANPALSATDEALVSCAATARLGIVAIAGGCDGDNFLDAGESVTLTAQLVNAGAETLRNVRARLVSDTSDVYVEPLTGSYGDIPAGGAATNAASAYRLSALPGVAPRSTVTLRLEVLADGRDADPVVLALPLTLEADEVVTNGSFFENFNSVGFSCSGSACSENVADGCLQDTDCPASTCGAGGTCTISGRPCTQSSECTNTCTATTDIPDGNWYYFDVNGNCESSESTWSMQTCSGSRRPALPTCNGTVTGNGTATFNHVLVSPILTAGAAGSTTTLQLLTFKETAAATLNPNESTVCDRMQVRVFSNTDGVINDTEYVRGQQKSVSLTEATTTVDFAKSFVWTVPPTPNARVNQLLFWAFIDSQDGGACTATDAESIRWNIDDVNLTYVNREIVDDATAPCAPGCTDPAVPLYVTVTEYQPGVLTVAWDPAAGAHHYDVYRQRADGPSVFHARVTAPATTLADPVPDDAIYWYRIVAVSENGLCRSAESDVTTGAGTGSCANPPGAPSNLQVVRDQLAGCSLTVSWGAAAGACGAPVEYQVYRGTSRDFVPGPHNLLATTSATSLVDTKVASGYDNSGEPVGTEYTYVVRAADTVSGVVEKNDVRAFGRASGPLGAGTWTEDGGDLALPKVEFATLQDYNATGASWSRTTFTIDHQANGVWTYVAARDAFLSTAYEDLACITLDTPPIRLASSGTSEFRVWMNYQIEFEWDGLVVEVSANGGPFTPIAPNGGYPGTFAQTVAGPCQGSPNPPTGFINACNYGPTQGAITGPASGDLSGWIEYVFNLAAYQGQDVRLRLALSSDCGSNGAVVVDEMRVTNALLPTACTGSACLPPPSFEGIASARDLDPAADTGVRLTWGAVGNWGGGGPGTFVLFRNDEEIGTVASNVTSFVDDAAQDNELFRYAVVARGGGSCGVPSGAADVSLAAADCTGAAPGAVDGATLSVELGIGSIILTSTPIDGAGSYRFLYANDPAAVAGSTTFLQADGPEARHMVLNDGLNWFYLVRDGESSDCAP